MAKNNRIQFRSTELHEAGKLADKVRLGGVNVSDLARAGLREKLQEALSTEDKTEVYRRYEAGEVSEDVATILLGDLEAFATDTKGPEDGAEQN